MNFSKSIFWDVKPSELHKEEHARFIISRVVQRGLIGDWTELRKIYASVKIKQEIVEISNLDKKTLNFLSLFYKIPKENFRCYTKTPLSNQHWNS
ncbi:MAG: hypothetical protein QMB13_04050 [Flavobacteriales bacterium]|jgi:hypothetical protein|tara:strand:- start:1722 stop:2006 length:285 start_codon:yes stop_codon:yes gene_type:complete